MSKLIPMEEAAQLLGVSVEKLNELRSNNEVFGYRDGSTWKFKMAELERVADDMGLSISPLESAVDGVKDMLGLNDDELDTSELDLGLEESSTDLLLEADSDSIAMDDSSIELFQSPIGTGDGGTSSDVLSGDDEDDDDLIDLAESGLLVKSSSKDMVLDREGDDELSLSDSSDDLDLDESSDDFSLEDSVGDLKLEDSSDDLKLEESSDDLKLEESSAELKLEDSSDDLLLEGSSSELKIKEDASVKLADESVLDEEDELSFGSSSLDLASESKGNDSPSATGDDLFSEEPSSDAPSTGKLAGSLDDGNDDLGLGIEDDLFDDDLGLADSASFESSEISNDFEESGDLVLESDSSGELTLEANESGIELSANESGIALGEEPFDLGGSDIDELELPEDDDMILVDDAAASDSATLMQEDDFNLTPQEMSLDDDDSSGSQVIALAESEIYADDSEATVLGSESFGDDSFAGGDFDPTAAGMVGAGAVGAAAMTAAGGGSGIAAEEVTYSKWQIGGLALTASALLLGSIVAYGTAQNLWLPDDEVVNSGIMKMFIDSLGMN